MGHLGLTPCGPLRDDARVTEPRCGVGRLGCCPPRGTAAPSPHARATRGHVALVERGLPWKEEASGPVGRGSQEPQRRQAGRAWACSLPRAQPLHLCSGGNGARDAAEPQALTEQVHDLGSLPSTAKREKKWGQTRSWVERVLQGTGTADSRKVLQLLREKGESSG